MCAEPVTLLAAPAVVPEMLGAAVNTFNVKGQHLLSVLPSLEKPNTNSRRHVKKND